MEQVNALEQLKRFCLTFNGNIVYLHGNFYQCNIPKTMSYDDLSKMLVYLRSDSMRLALNDILKEYLDIFDINFTLTDKMGANIVIRGADADIIRINIDFIKQYDIPINKIEYIYPGVMTKYEPLFGGDVKIMGYAAGTKNNGKFAVHVQIKVLIYKETLTPEDANMIIEKVKEIKESFVANPRNYAKLK